MAILRVVLGCILGIGLAFLILVVLPPTGEWAAVRFPAEIAILPLAFMALGAATTNEAQSGLV